MTKSKIWLSSPHIGETEEMYVKEAFDTNWIAPLGPHVNGFEEDIQQYTGVTYAAALTSGTAALHLGLILLDVKPGDIVLCQSMTFSASANPIVYQGAIPVFIDSEQETWNMCPNALEDAIKAIKSRKIKLDHPSPTYKIKAIIPVHLYGMPANMDAINQIGNQYNIPILEDAAEALGSRYNDRPCGSLSKLGVLSFNGNKIITTSGGGALLSNDEALIQKARFLATQARDPAPHYQHSHIGYNYRLSNVLAGIGRGQMAVLNDRVRARRSNYQRYKKYFSTIDGVYFQEPKEEGVCFSNRWLSTIGINPDENGGIDRETIRLALEKENIEARPLWKPMHMQPVFSNAFFMGGETCERLFNQGLCLPSGSNLTDGDFERIFDCLDSVFY